MEKMDPYLKDRIEKAKKHRVLFSLDIKEKKLIPAIENKNIAGPSFTGTVEEIGWSEASVDNIMDAHRKGYIKIIPIGEGAIRIEMRPIKNLPSQLGHVAELGSIQKNFYSDKKVFGSEEDSQLTYLQTTDFAVEGYLDDETDGSEYGRIYVDTDKLLKSRDVYLDPESLNITDYEYGYAFCVLGGVPFCAINRIDVIRARKIFYTPLRNDFDEGVDQEKEADRQTERLKKFLSEL